ncbi:MAG: hypothetical protein B6U95_06240 [Thermofilum sp. ex4484_82]|nr:MAG: hypothetical protein B6U95_06240 [Thermofilum sp. ex4484_82]OYT37617.1 MAG: hypothetical protein B6U96_06230 [Archaeoglobales archaeon ex4484_92]
MSFTDFSLPEQKICQPSKNCFTEYKKDLSINNSPRKAFINKVKIGEILKRPTVNEYYIKLKTDRREIDPYSLRYRIAREVFMKFRPVLVAGLVKEENLYLYVTSNVDSQELVNILKKNEFVDNVIITEQSIAPSNEVLSEMLHFYFRFTRRFQTRKFQVETKDRKAQIYVEVSYVVLVEDNDIFLEILPKVSSTFIPIRDFDRWLNQKVLCQNIGENSFSVGTLLEVPSLTVSEDRQEKYAELYLKYTGRKWEGEDPPSLYDLWRATGHSVKPNESVVKIKSKSGKKEIVLNYPESKIFTYEHEYLPRQYFLKIINEYLTSIPDEEFLGIKISPEENFQQMELLDLMDKIELKFKNGVATLTRDSNKPDRLNATPQSFLRRLGPISDPQKLLIIFVHPKDMGGRMKNKRGKIISVSYPRNFIQDLSEAFKRLSLIVKDGLQLVHVTYELPDLSEDNEFKWLEKLQETFTQEKIKEIQKIIKQHPDAFPIILCAIPAESDLTLKFKNLLHGFLVETFEIPVQGVDPLGIAMRYIKANKMNKETKKLKKQKNDALEKLALVLYYNALVNSPRFKGREGILWRLNKPMGGRTNKKRVYIGYDASGDPFKPSSSPVGAFYVILDDYGRVIKTKTVEEAGTHIGRLNEQAINEIFQLFVKMNKKDLPDEIIFIIDGKFSSVQLQIISNMYEKLKQTLEEKTPTLFLVEARKRIRLRIFTIKNNEAENIPFGHITFLSNNEVLAIFHILLTSKDKLKRPVRYVFREKLTKDGYKKTNRKEIINIMKALFHSSFLTFSTGSVPYRLCKPIHSTDKLSRLYYNVRKAINVIKMKE